MPTAPMIQGADGNFYATTYDGGVNNLGTIFGISPTGFANLAGALPEVTARIPAEVCCRPATAASTGQL